MAKKSILKITLGDGKHWVGWILTTIMLVGIFSILPPGFIESYLGIVLLTLGIIVSVDVFKHYAGLQ